MCCARCGGELEPNALGGLCPVCLFDSALPDDERDEPGSFHYDLIEEIARGGMGVVYRATQHGSQRLVAVKMILAEQAATPGMMERFRAEAEAVASLDHPHILPIYEIGESEGRPFYSMKFADGGTLRERAAEFAEPRQAARLIATLARAVHHAHERGILHRDLKPGNVLLDGEERRAFVSDFGLAKWIGRESRLTLAQSALGTPHYIAPEQAAGHSTRLTAAADVYSLGAMLYELVTGRPPFEGDSALETLRLARDMPTPSPRKFKPSVPRDLEVICLKCLAKEPAARYASAAALAGDLERWLEGHTIMARPATAAERAWRWTKRNRALAGLSAALALALVFVIFALTKSPSSVSATTPAKSIAVLPFENLDQGPESGYFAQGVQDEILTRLARIADLKVISRASTERFAKAPPDLRSIAQQLGVAHVLRGRVHSANGTVRVSVQLINATNDQQLWAETYERKLTDIFAVEGEIAKAVADKLQARLSGSEQRAVAAHRTQNPAAHAAYIKGRFFWNKRTAADLKKAIDYLNQAIAADPNYALAYAALADAYLLSPFFGAGTPQESYPKAKESAIKALTLDDKLAEAHIAHAEAVRLCDMDMAGAEVEFRRGLELDPNYATGHHWYGNGVLTGLGRFDEAISELKRAVELDPLSLIINADLGTAYTFARRYDEAIEQYRRTLEMDQRFQYARWGLAVALELKGSFDEAQGEFAKARQLSDDPWVIALQAHAYNAAGKKAEATKLVNELRELAKTRYVSRWALTTAHLAVGEYAEAITVLEKSFADRDGAALTFIRVDPYFDPLRGDPRFQALVAKVLSTSSSKPTDVPDHSVAVLPFIDLSPAKDQEYFCDGISEQILDSLARVEGLQVAARRSSFSFKGTKLDVKEIAAKLGVRHLLEGSLRRDGNRIRITTQLIDSSNGFHIWSDTYERELQSAFAVQDEITKAITGALKLKLAAGPTRSVNPEAYDLYLQGMFFSNKSTEDGLRKSLEFFERSLEKDPNSAKTYAGIAKTWNWLADAYVRPVEAFPKMKAAAQKAVELDEQLADGHIWVGNAKRILDWDIKGCWAEMDRALELDPNSADAHSLRALGELCVGNKQKASEHIKASVRLDPLSPIISNFAAVAYLCAGEVDEAIVEAKRLLQLDPNYIYESPVLGEAYYEKGRYDEAIVIFQRAQQLTGAPQPGLAITYARLGREAEARQILGELKKVAATKYIAAEEIASVYLALGEIDEAFAWLERGYADHGGAFHAIAVRPEFRSLHPDPRFRDLLRRIGIDPERVFKPGK
jgi:TolB-like protein/Tfp pilus assembly protein PilF/predicted Ser/Thr protein kinase